MKRLLCVAGIPRLWYTLGMKEDIKKVLGYLRRADQRYGLIAPGDRIAVGVSGGKDSLTLVHALTLYKQFSKKEYGLFAVTVDLGLRPFDLAPVASWCEGQGVPFTAVPTQIGKTVFEDRKEKNPCALCAKLRRGALHRAAVAMGCNKAALGHNREDTAETFFMNLLYGRRLAVFAPAERLSRTGLTLIRPLLLCPEATIAGAAKSLGLPILPSPCPANGHTARQTIKELLRDLNRKYPNINERVVQALDKPSDYELWNGKGATE